MKFTVICQDQQMRASLRHLIQQYDPKITITDTESIGSAAKINSEKEKIDLAIYYIDLLNEGWEELKQLRSQLSEIPILVIGDYESNEQIRKTIFTGADGCISIHFTWRTAVTVIERILKGEIVSPPIHYHVDKKSQAGSLDSKTAVQESHGEQIRLTPRQLSVLKLIQQGKSNKEIARELDMALSTVKIHCAAIFKELGVNNRTQAARVIEQHFDLNLTE